MLTVLKAGKSKIEIKIPEQLMSGWVTFCFLGKRNGGKSGLIKTVLSSISLVKTNLFAGQNLCDMVTSPHSHAIIITVDMKL